MADSSLGDAALRLGEAVGLLSLSRSVGRGGGRGGGNILTAQLGLRSWDPWTNRQRRSGRRGQRKPTAAAGPDGGEAAANIGAGGAASGASTQKAAGGLYDSMVRAEQLTAARRSRVRRVVMLNTNNNTNELLEGLKDIQRHRGATGQGATTVITRLASAAASGGGGVLDVNFLMDSSTSNASETRDRRGLSEGSGGTVSTADVSAPYRPELPTEPFGFSFPKPSQPLNSEMSRPGTSTVDMERTSGRATVQQDEQKWEIEQEPVQPPDQWDGGSQAPPETTETPSQQEAPEAPDSGDVDGDDYEGEAEGEGADNEEEEAPPQAEEKPGAMSSRKKLNISYLHKEGTIIGCMNVFADVMRKEFVILLTDRVVAGFLTDPSQFRAIASRTGCEIEVTRRILNRRIGSHRWVKYLVISIKGPNTIAINQCDRLMVKLFPPYKARKEYADSAHVSLFVKESYPDNTKLYFNFQRTGPTRVKLGEMRLQTPFDSDSSRPLEDTPWKYADWRLFKGMLEPRNLAVENLMQHVYPEWGTEIGSFLDKNQKWENAGDFAIDLEKKKNLERSARVKNRKMDAEPLFAEEG